MNVTSKLKYLWKNILIFINIYWPKNRNVALKFRLCTCKKYQFARIRRLLSCTQIYNIYLLIIIKRKDKSVVSHIFKFITNPRFLDIYGCYKMTLFGGQYMWFHMWRWFCHHLSLIPPTFGFSGGLCFVIVAFPGHLILYIIFSFWNPLYE